MWYEFKLLRIPMKKCYSLYQILFHDIFGVDNSDHYKNN